MMTGDIADETVEELIIRMSRLSYERMPMLEVIFERYILSLGSALKSFAGVPVDVTLESLDYLACGDALGALPSPSLLAVTSADPWEGSFLTSVAPELLFSMLEIMLGGKLTPGKVWAPRSFTAIERRFGTRLCDVVLGELSRAFDQLSQVAFKVDHLESNPQATALAPASSPCVKVTLAVRIEEGGGPLTFMIPYNAIEKIRPVLAQPFLGGKLGGDSSWREEMKGRIQDATVRLDAHLHELTVPMTEMLGWRRGQTLDLGIGPEHEVAVRCSGREMFRAAMGRRANGSVALRVTDEAEDWTEGTDGRAA